MFRSWQRLVSGDYVMEFDTGDYFASKEVRTPDQPFFPIITVHFELTDVLSPFGVQVYRGG